MLNFRNIKGSCPFDTHISGVLSTDLSAKNNIILIKTPTFEVIQKLQNVRGIVCEDKLSQYCHELLLLKDLHTPLIYGVGKRISDYVGKTITMSGVNGKGTIIEGIHRRKQPITYELKTYAMTSTIAGMRHYLQHNSTVVATRSEFMLLPVLRQHPLSTLETRQGRKLIYSSIYTIMEFACDHFSKAIYRFSDFSEESLHHFPDFNKYEQEESNPALGNRGAYRLLHTHKKLFNIELQVMNDLSKKYSNLEILFPYVRSIDEAKKLHLCVKKTIKRTIHIGCMIEVPSLLFDGTYLDSLFDFFIIGTKDLTQLLYGYDRNNTALTTKSELISSLLHQHFLPTIGSKKTVYVTSKDIYNDLKYKYHESVVSLND